MTDARQVRCLALNVYWEARSEPARTQRAIAYVTLNRVGHEGYPDSICGVVQEAKQGGRGRCQFSWWCDGKSDQPLDAESWQQALDVARAAIAHPAADPTHGALYFHLASVRPHWARHKARVGRFGPILFYR